MPFYNDFYPILSLLRIARERGEYSEYIKMTVEDAQIVRTHPDKVRSIRRETYRYAVKLGRSNSHILEEIKADQLQRTDILKLIDFFENL